MCWEDGLAGVACRVGAVVEKGTGDAWKRWRLRPLRPSDLGGSGSVPNEPGGWTHVDWLVTCFFDSKTS